MPAPFRRLPRRAFTLVELLVVIAVLGILAAILIPVVARVRASARSTHCVSNLQQLGRAFTLHAEDHRGCLPAPVAATGEIVPWYAAIQPYTGSPWTGDFAQLAAVFSCPTWSDLDARVPAPDDIGYAMSAVLGATYAPTRPVALSSITEPSRTVLVLELSGSDSIVFPRADDPSGFAAWYCSHHDGQGCDRHGGGANYLFADGHVAYHTPQSAATLLE